jgi:glucosamine 6-phosphate synthetase-like amidotransferase/phosphosugar isomerase protein
MTDFSDLKVLLLILMIPIFVGAVAISGYSSRIMLLNVLTYDAQADAQIKQVEQKTKEIDERLNQIQKQIQEQNENQVRNR